MNFTPQQKYSLLSKMGYSGSPQETEMDNFIQSNPGAAAKMGKFDRAMKRGFAQGGLSTAEQSEYSRLQSTTPKELGFQERQRLSELRRKTQQPTTTTSAPITPKVATATSVPSTPKTPASSLTSKKQAYTPYTGNVADAQREFLSAQRDLVNKERALESATPKITTKSDGTVSIEGTDKTFKTTAEAQKFIEENSPSYKSAMEALESAQKNFSQGQQTLKLAQSAQRTTLPSASNLYAKALQDPSSLVTDSGAVQVQVSPDQFIAEGTGQVGAAPVVEDVSVAESERAEAVETTPTATFEAKEVTPDVSETLEELRAVTADPTEKATVKGQLESLMEDFEGGETPPWASGAMRQAMGIMQQRGLGASSIAGQAITQAAIEAALPIAQADAATTAQFELQSMNNEQQTIIFKTQQRINSLLSDQAAINAAEQFNAASENQTNQFFADLQSTVSRFNADQINAIAQFNAGEENAIAQFNSSLVAQRDQFNANNRLVVAQANAKWRQEIATINAMAQNEANMQTAKVANGLTTGAMDNIWQRERDLMSFAWQSSENKQDRDVRLLIGDKELAAADKAGKGSIFGSIAGEVAGSLVSGLFG